MTDPKTPAQLASDAAEAVRALNHATLSPGGEGWRHPGDAYSVIGGLDQMVRGLDQSLDQVWSLLAGLANDGHITSSGGTPNRDLHSALATLNAARAAAVQMTAALEEAHKAVSPLAYKE